MNNYFSLFFLVHTHFQPGVIAGHLWESKQIFFLSSFFFFFPLWYSDTKYERYFSWQSICSDDTLDNRQSKKSPGIIFMFQTQVCSTEKLKINK